MRLQVILAAVAFFAASAIAHAADPAGTYTVEGTSPDGGGTYSGELTITKTGDTYKAVWTIGDETYVGTGLGAEDFHHDQLQVRWQDRRRALQPR